MLSMNRRLTLSLEIVFMRYSATVTDKFVSKNICHLFVLVSSKVHVNFVKNQLCTINSMFSFLVLCLNCSSAIFVVKKVHVIDTLDDYCHFRSSLLYFLFL